MKDYVCAAVTGILSAYRVQYTEDGPKLDLPPPELLAETAWKYAEALYAKEQSTLSKVVEIDTIPGMN